MTRSRPLDALLSWVPSFWRLRRRVSVPVVYYRTTGAGDYQRDTSRTAVLVLRRRPAGAERFVPHDPGQPAPDAAFIDSLAAVATWAEGRERMPAGVSVSWELTETDGRPFAAAGPSYGAALAIGVAYLFGLTAPARRRLSRRAVASAAVLPEGLLSGVSAVAEKAAALPDGVDTFLVAPDDGAMAAGSTRDGTTVVAVRSVPEAVTASRLRRSRPVAWAAGLVVTLIVAGSAVDRQLGAAEAATRRDLAIRAAGLADLTITSQPDRAGLLALAADRLLPGDARAERALFTSGNADSRLAAVLPGDGSTVTALAYSPDGGSLAVAADTGVTLWDVTTRQPGRRWHGTLPGRVSAVAFAGGGREVVAADESGGVVTWARDSPGGPGTPFDQVGGAVTGLAVSPDGVTIAAAVTGAGAMVWDSTGRASRRTVIASPAVAAVVFSDDGTLVAGQDRPAGGDTLVAVSLPDDRRRAVLTEKKQLFGFGVTALAVDPARRWLYSGHLGGGSVRRWSTPGLKAAGAFETDQEVGGLAATAGNVTVAGTGLLLGGTVDPRAGGSSVTPWNPETRTPVTTVLGGRGFRGLTSVLAANPRTGQTAVGSDGGTVTLWHPTGAPAPGNGVNSMATDLTTPDTVLVLRSDGRLQRYAPATGTVQDLATAGSRVVGISLGVRPDGRQIAVGFSDGRVHLRTAPFTGLDRVLTAGGPGDGIFTVAYSPDGRLLATGGSRGTVTVWDLTGPRLLWSEDTTERAVSGVAFSPDGSTVLIGDLDGRLRARAVTDQPGAPDRTTVSPGSSPYLLRPTARGLLVGQANGTLSYADAGLRPGARLPFDSGGAVMSAAESVPAGLLLIGTDAGGAILADRDTGAEVYRLAVPEAGSGAVRGVAFTADGRYAVAGNRAGQLGTVILDRAELSRRICAYTRRGLTERDTTDAREITRRTGDLC